jgi:transcriptional regulator with XRE-family HTH domain
MQENQKTRESIVERRLRERREALGLAQEKIGVAIGLDESSPRARISRYELGIHEPPYATVQLLAEALQVSTCYLYCDDDKLAELIQALEAPSKSQRNQKISDLLNLLPRL